MIISYGYPILLDNDKENYIFEYALYNSIYKQLWTIGILGTFVVASFGPNNILGSFLSSRIWIPFSKLSYGLYLMHWGVLIISFANSSDLMRPTSFNIVRTFSSKRFNLFTFIMQFSGKSIYFRHYNIACSRFHIIFLA